MLAEPEILDEADAVADALALCDALPRGVAAAEEDVVML